jgi:magnesium chelatase family protein
MTDQTPSFSKNDMDINRSIPFQEKDTPSSIPISISTPKARALDFSDINAQLEAKRCLEIAAAGFHHTMIIGPPGSGKTMLLNAFPSILPDNPPVLFLTPHTRHKIETIPPFHGVLIMDELLQFKTPFIESLRLPMENYPFMLITALNPLEPTDSLYKKEQQRFHKKITPPFLDRIHLTTRTRLLTIEEITGPTFTRNKFLAPEKSKTVKARIEKAQDIQFQRFKDSGIFLNGQMDNRALIKYCTLNNKGTELMNTAVEQLNLSTRGCLKTLKVARTIADLEGCLHILESHVQEAVQYTCGRLPDDGCQLPVGKRWKLEK